jgi:diaminopimelate decarboxylase
VIPDPGAETEYPPLPDDRPVPWDLLPDSAAVVDDGWLAIGGCSMADLVREFGTPLFVYDEEHLRARCREAVDTFGDGVSYAGKAFLCLAMARLVHEEGMHLDVATGGEMHVALRAGMPAERLVLHGNNKSEAELQRARDVGVGRIVVDSFDELDRLDRLHAADGLQPRVLLRATPGVQAHTHEFVQTGQVDSKFGFGVAAGDLGKAVERAAASPSVELVGVHTHIGSQIFVAAFFRQAIDVIAPWVRDLDLPELSLGGGLGVPYVAGEEAPTLSQWGRVVIDACREAGIRARVTAEPGRVIAARAAVTLYTAGTVKDIPGVRTYVAVDGGMSDNPRPWTHPAPGPSRWWASTASPATSWCATPGCPPTSGWGTSWPHRSPAPTATPWAPTTTRCPAPRSCSPATATPAWSSGGRPKTTSCAWTCSRAG